ncbi:carbonic anhydrase 9 isoform X1 [Oxyura jamaicensis]|uniref:carbonic anhydrase 9 isoform X1 n=1 Tax=Oxyura jamaicensis TaxID=8884 RepID=UPI0015A6C974|nr:carbonic anhydrase 9 isoform X1 [Oxyura jamaicensis]
MRLRVSLPVPVLVLILAATGRAAAGQGHDDEESLHSEERGPGDSHWSYEEPERWGKHYPACSGTMQSPINIETEKTIFTPQLQPIQLSGYSLPASKKLKLKNNGHTVVLELPESLAITGGYAQQYRAVQLHLHWGSPTTAGSEHTVNGKRFAAELHVVHYNTKYDSFTVAMDRPDGLAVLGAFLEVSPKAQPWARRGGSGAGVGARGNAGDRQWCWCPWAGGCSRTGCPSQAAKPPFAAVLQVGPRENPFYQEIIKRLHKIQHEDEEVMVPGFNIAGLLPDSLHLYFRYNGSLTTPPCFQSVTWTVFNQTVMLSHDQLSVLVTSLQYDYGKPLQNNFRPLQDLHKRWVLASFEPTFSREKQVPTAGQTSSSFHAGDVLAVVFGVLFAITALAFMFYVYKHRSQNARLDSPTKSKVIYTAATTENTA